MFLLDFSPDVYGMLQQLLDLLRMFGLVSNCQSRHFQHDNIALFWIDENTEIQAPDQSEHKL